MTKTFCLWLLYRHLPQIGCVNTAKKRWNFDSQWRGMEKAVFLEFFGSERGKERRKKLEFRIWILIIFIPLLRRVPIRAG